MWECECCEHLNPIDKDRCENCHSRRHRPGFGTEEEQKKHGYPSLTIQDEQDEKEA